MHICSINCLSITMSGYNYYILCTYKLLINVLGFEGICTKAMQFNHDLITAPYIVQDLPVLSTNFKRNVARSKLTVAKLLSLSAPQSSEAILIDNLTLLD